MPTIYDNVETPFLENDQGNGLKDALKVSQKGDFCVGYFNLRGWKAIDTIVEAWPRKNTPPCRLLVGMQRLPQDEIKILMAGQADQENRISNQRANELKRRIAKDFQRQLSSRRGARYRTYYRLQDFLREREGDLFLTDRVREAIQAVYDHPLTTQAVDKLNRQLRSGISDDELAELVTAMHQDDRLVMVRQVEHYSTDTRILCSLGLKTEKEIPCT